MRRDGAIIDGMGEPSDWIKNLKRDTEQDAKSRESAEQYRLHIDTLIKSKSPAFWSRIASQVRKECEELNATFPNDDRRRVQLEATGDEFTITNCIRPAKSLQANINSTLLFADVKIRTRENIETRPQMVTREIAFALNSERDLYGKWEGKVYVIPEDLAGALIREVIGLA
jgi:hypothetical protein